MIITNLAGQMIDGYHLERLIAEGGMAQVYVAHKNGDDRVALKILHSDYGTQNTFRARFMREVKLLKSLQHPNILPIYDYGISNTFVYLTMPLMSGRSLGDVLAEGCFSPARTWSVLQPIIRGLQHGHDQNVLHRDIKPDNILIEPHEDHQAVFLVDYGLGRRDHSGDTITQAKTSIGTPDYMSPEAVRGDSMDSRSDLYSLGVVVYEMLLGVLPFDVSIPHLIAMAHATQPPIPPGQRHPDFPAALEKVILKALEKSPDNRYPTAEAFGNEFYNALMRLSDDERERVYQNG